MARAALEKRWDETAAIIATIVNMTPRGRDAKPVHARDLNPYLSPEVPEARPSKPPDAPITALLAFVPKDKRPSIAKLRTH